MKTMALLSTWQEKCGIAHYSYFLKRALDPHLKIEVVPLPRETMRDETDHSKADAYIAQIVPKLRDFDIVCVQFEPSLFGDPVKLVPRRFGQVVDNSRDMVITFHSFHGTELPSIRHLLNAVLHLSLSRALNHLAQVRRALIWRGIYRKIARHGRRFKVTLIAHTKTDAKSLRRLIPGVDVRDNPLSYMDEGYINGLDGLARTSGLPRLLPKVPPDVRFIGVFGFFSPQKGFETAILALNYLPPHFHLLMVSGVHEADLRVGEGLNTYLDSIIKLVEKHKLFDRVHFIGSVGDDDMLIAMKICDAAIMPYINTGQSGSGPTSQAIELDRPTFLTRSLQFIEFEKYLPGTFQFFDIGNHIELAQKILRAPKGNDRKVGELRLVDFPRIPRPITITDTVSNYIAASGVTKHRAAPRADAIAASHQPRLIAGE
jgi:glycosyltransferase involved in cell wall biosynthesis